MKFKIYLLIFGWILSAMGFFTWKQITVFSLGYKISGLQAELLEAEIENQRLMAAARESLSVRFICARSSKELGMRVPLPEATKVLELEKSGMFEESPAGSSLISYVREIFRTPAAQAR